MKKNTNLVNNIKLKIILIIILLITCLVSGVLMLYYGITNTNKLNKISKEYNSIIAYYKDYNIYSINKDNNKTYRLNYTYIINNKEYTISTNYGSNYIPQQGSTREVRYNPNNPEDAFLVGTNKNTILIFMGSFFVLCSLGFIFSILNNLGIFNIDKINIPGLFIGIILLIVGFGIIIFQNNITQSFRETCRSFGIFIIIPLMFIIIGIVQIINCIFKKVIK